MGCRKAGSVVRLQRLAIVCFEDPRHVTGGVQRRVAAEIEYFAPRGVDVTVITNGSGERTAGRDVTYISVSTPQVVYPLRSLIFSAKASRVLRNLPAFDVIETHHDAGAAGLLSLFHHHRAAGTAFVEVVHGVLRDEYAAIRRYETTFSRGGLAAIGLLPLSWVEQLAARRADAVVAVSEYSAGQIAARYGVPPERIYVVPNGIDTSRYTPSAHKPKIGSPECSVLYVGRFHTRKGVLQLLKAVSTAYITHKNLRRKLVGHGPLEAALRAEAERLRLSEVVDFLGPLDDKAVLEAYRSADIVCVPSLQEGQGIVALEAQACGVPVVATRAGGLAEAVLHKRTGLLVLVGDTSALARALTKLAGSPALRREFGRNAVLWAHSYRWDTLLSQQEMLYENLHRVVRRLAGALL
jgi:glycosyltransferase involved in cell wall biosynthesis